ncbi:helicase-related protein [Catelliglobosispora koreensis]|uniref:helicase-related protein n=1 Tax=Catelliglobosispora koreensis TaxID=129052 RepID=UPI0003706E5A|nr:helicase-related protein [Catelliglobosispora koreensis]
MSTAVGALVRARGREWVVLPGSSDDFFILRPLGGGDDDIAGVFADEGVTPATFDRPRPDDLGDDLSARLLRDALRIGFRASGGPFRSLARLAVEPRPYQLVPLLLALRQEVVRLLIADDVGIGKTIEAALIAAELREQGTIDRFAILCPPSLADQWQQELATKFGIHAELVLPSTVRKLERGLEYGQSVFERHEVTIVSTDFIKADNRRDDFLRAAPELVIVDEAHSSVSDDTGTGGRGRTQRYRLVKDLARRTDRHLILVTATPHSGNDTTFRNLIALLDPALHDADLSNEAGRRRLAGHMVQRRRHDIRGWLAATKFPTDRETIEDTYQLSPQYRALFEDVLAYAKGQVTDESGTRVQQRVRWWSALSLLRALASSPAAAAATLRSRAQAAGADTPESVDRMSVGPLYELADDESAEGSDTPFGALVDDQPNASPQQALLGGFAARAAGIATEAEPARREEQDAKLAVLVKTVKKLHKDGFHPIVFCRFIHTAEYVANHLRERFAKARIQVVTGEHPPEDRAERVREFASQAGEAAKILVATDCLSEGVNLQEDFQAVIHYDLAWNPTRHEQREGRVDRFGQPAEIVRAVTLYGSDNGIDKIVMDVLIRKHEAIRRDLGISVPVPASTEQVLNALMDTVLRSGPEFVQDTLFEMPGEIKQLELDWQSSAEEERKVRRTRFAQASISPDEVQNEIDAYRRALGTPDDIAGFVRTALKESGATVLPHESGGLLLQPQGLPIGLLDALGRPNAPIPFMPDLPATRGSAVLQRTDPRVAAIARYVLDASLDSSLPASARPARRCGLIVTKAVDTATIALLVRFRIHLTLPGRAGPHAQVTEEARVLAFTGSPTSPTWLDQASVDRLLAAKPDANMPPDVARNMMTHILASIDTVTPHLDKHARSLADELRQAHVRVRTAARGDRAGALTIRGLTVQPQLPADILGVYLYQPGGTK